MVMRSRAPCFARDPHRLTLECGAAGFEKSAHASGRGAETLLAGPAPVDRSKVHAWAGSPGNESIRSSACHIHALCPVIWVEAVQELAVATAGLAVPV